MSRQKAKTLDFKGQVLLHLDENRVRNQYNSVVQKGLMAECRDCSELTAKDSDYYCSRLKHPL